MHHLTLKLREEVRLANQLSSLLTQVEALKIFENMKNLEQNKIGE